MDTTIKLELSEDKMKAFITIPPDEKYQQLTAGELIRTLQSGGILHGILEEEVARIVKNRMYNRRVLVARGTPPVKGKDASIRYRFEPDKKLSEVMNAKGDDLKLPEMSFLKKVIEGQEVAVKEPATAGTEGATVTGVPLPTQAGQDVPLEGERVRTSQDGLRMLADESGHVVLDGKLVRVVPLFSVDQDVDRNVGSIDFDGSVLIKGSVDGDYSIKASCDIEINGNIGKATIEAGGNIYLKGGIQGKGEATIKAGRDIALRFVENASLIAGGSIYANGHVMSCTIEAGKSVIADGRKASIVGGRVMAFEKVRAANIGSRDNVVTKIELGTPVLQKKWEDGQKQELEPQIIKAYEVVKKVKEALAKLEEKKAEQGGVLLPKEASFYERLTGERKRIQAELESSLARLEQIRKGMDVSRMQVEVLSTCYSGVSIQIGEAREEIHEAMQSIRFIKYGDQINPERL